MKMWRQFAGLERWESFFENELDGFLSEQRQPEKAKRKRGQDGVLCVG